MSKSPKRGIRSPDQSFVGHSVSFEPVGKMFLLDAPGFQRHVLSRAEVEILKNCRESATLEKLETRVHQALGIGDEGRKGVRTVLESLVDRGLLFPVPEKLKPQVKPERRAKRRISALCIPTCGRESFKTTLLTFSEAILAADRKDVRVVIVDDSRSEAKSAENRKMIQFLKKSGKLPRIFYSDRSSRAKFARLLARESGVPREVVEFGLLGTGSVGPLTIGASRNCLLLETTGEMIISTDDDTVGRYVSTQISEDDPLRICRESPCLNRWAPLSELKAMRDQAPVPDFLAIHEKLLGRDPWEAVSEDRDAGKTPVVEDIIPTFITRFKRRDRRIIFTRTGNFGDSGMGSGISAFFYPLAQLKPMISDPERYRQMLTSHTALFASSQYTIALTGDLMATHFGLDNRTTPLPYVPFGRGEDSLFGEMMVRADAGSFFGYVPYSCAHFPTESRSAPMSDLWDEWTNEEIQFPTVLKWLSKKFAKYEDPENLGEFLMKMAREPSEEFELYIRCATLGSLIGKANRLAELTKPELGVPAYVIKDLEDGLERIENRLRSLTKLTVIGVPNPGKKNHTQECADLVFKMGQLISGWPAMVDAAKRLRSRGEGLAREL